MLIFRIIEIIEIIVGLVGAQFNGIIVYGCFVLHFADNFTGICMSIITSFYVLVFIRGCFRNRFRHRYYRYLWILSENSTGSIQQLADELEKPIEKVKKDLKKMIDKNLFVNAWIDDKNDRIYLPSIQRAYSEITYVTYQCPNCAGYNKIPKGAMVECDYCGSILQA